MARVEAQQREDIKTPAGAFKTIRYEAFLFNDVLYRRYGHLYVWLSDDARKLPVQIRVRLQFDHRHDYFTTGEGRKNMKWLACFWAAAAMAWAQSGGALLLESEALKLERRTVQLMESTGVAVPGLARAGAPALEDARQSLTNLETAPQNAGHTYTFLSDARAYLAISDTVPKPYPFPEEGRRQFGELRDAVDRIDSHFRALLDLKEAQLRNPDRDNLKRYAEANEKLGAAFAANGRASCFWAIPSPTAGGSTNITVATATS